MSMKPEIWVTGFKVAPEAVEYYGVTELIEPYDEEEEIISKYFSQEYLNSVIEELTHKRKQPPPNDKWCIGCSPDNCSCCWDQDKESINNTRTSLKEELIDKINKLDSISGNFNGFDIYNYIDKEDVIKAIKEVIG